MSASAVVGQRADIGLVEWFRPREHERAEEVAAHARRLGVRHLRTAVSWADFVSPGGEDWYDWLIPRLAEDFEILPCFHYTPPSLGIEARTSAPPRDLDAFGVFVARVLDKYGHAVEAVELWNEPNNRSDWDHRLDPDWAMFAAMIGRASAEARARGKRVVLGGMCPIDPSWLERMRQHRMLEAIDVVGVHGFPGTWDFDWSDWPQSVTKARAVLDAHAPGVPIWITETAYSTWRHDEQGQIGAMIKAFGAPVERVYWSAVQDLDPRAAHRDGFHVDERQYHLGLVRADGSPKLAYRLWASGGLQALEDASSWGNPRRRKRAERAVLITGGAGFVGTNLAERLLAEGERVIVFDNLARPGVEQNLRGLCARHSSRLQVEVADVRDSFALEQAVRSAKQVYHFAAQVAVTTSVAQPRHDFDVNAAGTVNLLEAIRAVPAPPPLVFTSTNKVYGNLEDVTLERHGDRYQPTDPQVRSSGVSESRPLDFHSPYGCSKGAADQYVRDYARTYGLPAVVFRMSCIYGPHQCGNEDQGWVAHFVMSSLRRRALTIYGDGRQVRDVLFVEDLIDAFLLAQSRITALSGQAFNIGGGPGNTVSLLELTRILEDAGGSLHLGFADWRPGDQRYYVSDTARFREQTGWVPRIGVHEGVRRLASWMLESGRAGDVARLAS